MRRSRLLLIGGMLLLAGIIAAANVSQFSTLSHVQKQGAERRALDEANNVANMVPELDRLLTTGVPSTAQAAVIEALTHHGDISAVLLFDDSGNELLSFRPKAWTAAAGLVAASEAAARTALTTGVAQVWSEYGDASKSLPRLYSSAYVHFSDDHGVRLGRDRRLSQRVRCGRSLPGRIP